MPTSNTSKLDLPITLIFTLPLAWLTLGVLSFLISRHETSLSSVPIIGAALVVSTIAAWRSSWRHFVRDLLEFFSIRIPLAMVLATTVLAILLFDLRTPSISAIAVICWLSALSLLALEQAFHANPKRFLFVSVLVLLQAVLIVGLDFVVRHTLLPKKSHNRVFTEYDPLLGWKLRAGLSLDRRTDVYAAHETINSIGFRTKERAHEKPSGTRRIVALGDSHTEGYTVDDDGTYASLLESSLSATIPTQVISLGVGGYSTDQELLSYVQYGRDYHPDLVLLQFDPNDVRYNGADHYWRGPKPYFRRFGDMLLLSGIPVPDVKGGGYLTRGLLRHSAIAFLFDASILSSSAPDEDVSNIDVQEAWRVTDLLLRDLDRMVRSDGAVLLVFNSTPDDRKSDQRLRAMLSSHSIAYLDTEPAYEGDFVGHRVSGDPHWNRKGHRAIADRLSRCIAEHWSSAAGTSSF